MVTGSGSSNVTARCCAAALIPTPHSRALQSALRIQSSELWVANASGQPRPFGGGGVGLNDGEGGSGKRDGSIKACSGIAIAGDAGSGAGTATERTRSALPVISPQRHGPAAGPPGWPGRDGSVAG